MNKLLVFLLAILFTQLDTGLTSAQSPIEEIDGIVLEDKIFDAVDENRMLLLASLKDAKAHLSAGNFEKLAAEVDFETQRVVVFAWRGSGRDQISFSIAESYPEQIAFQFSRGMTRDLVEHQKIFALRSNVSCSIAGEAVELNPVQVETKEEYVRVEMRGKLATQNEGGCMLSVNGINVELDFQNELELKETASRLNGQTVVVTGDLELKAGNKKQNGWKVTVTTLGADE
ncbi:hypothetical protein OAG68_00160 [bacterium]|nr:hypothetical protein [bacterium]